MPPKRRKKPERPPGSCSECKPGGNRPAPYGTAKKPLCSTHYRARKLDRKQRSRNSYLINTYNLTQEQYDAIKESQGGRCFICQRATGASRNLSVDHDHSCCRGPKSCGKCVRALLCSPCNSKVLGHLRDEVPALERAIRVLTEHPAQEVLRGRT